MAYGNNRFVAVRRNKSLVSPDGETVSEPISTVGTRDLLGLGFGAGVFVAVGNGGFIASSTTGTAWVPRPQSPVRDVALKDVAHGANGLFVVVGNGETILTCAPAGLPPIITSAPTNGMAGRGHSGWLSVSTFRTLPESYQWFFNGTLLPGQTQSNLFLSNIQPSQAGRYSLQVANALGTAAITNIVAVCELTKHAGITITSAPNSTVTLQYRDTLQATSTWQFLANIYLGNPPVLHVESEPATAHPSRFFRGVSTGGVGSQLKVRLYNNLVLTGLTGLTYHIEHDDTPATYGPWVVATDLSAGAGTVSWTDLQSGDKPQRVYRVTIVAP